MNSSIRKEQEAFLLDFCKLIQWATSQGYTITAGELLRPVEMQEIYVKTGRSKTMNSFHLKKLAGDLNIFKNGKYICTIEELKPLGVFWESLSNKNVWGGNFDRNWTKEDNFKDAPHFERRI